MNKKFFVRLYNNAAGDWRSIETDLISQKEAMKIVKEDLRCGGKYGKTVEMWKVEKGKGCSLIPVIDPE